MAGAGTWHGTGQGGGKVCGSCSVGSVPTLGSGCALALTRAARAARRGAALRGAARRYSAALERMLIGDELRGAIGNKKRMLVPPPSRGSTAMLPPCASTI